MHHSRFFAAGFVLLFSLSAIQAPAQTVRLDGAIRDAAAYFNTELTQNTPVIVLNIESRWPDISNYIIEELTEAFVNGRRLNPLVRDRRQLDSLQRELSFQASGMVSDATAQSIGTFTGAQIIIRGSFTPLGNGYRLIVQALEVSTARIPGQQNYDIRIDAKLSALLRGPGGQRESPLRRFLWNGGDAWKRKWLYPGLRLGIAPHWYVVDTTRPDITADSYSAFEMAALLEVQIATLFSLQTEFVFSGDTVTVSNPDYGDIVESSRTLTIPLLAKLTWRPGIFYLAAFIGPNIALPLGNMELGRGGVTEHYSFSPTIGLTGGAAAGMQFGPGLLFLDLRSSGDVTFVQAGGNGQYRRNTVSVSLGYNYGLINKAAGRTVP
jgi:hypothetical protein